MAYHEKLWLSQCPATFKPIIYRRYVDDTFLLFSEIQQVDSFLLYLNTKHPNIKVTCERESAKKLAFLDINIYRDSVFYTNTYEKPTYTGLHTLFTSFIADKCKNNIVFVLFYRIARIASSLTLMHQDFENLTKILLKNGYPMRLIQEKIRSVVRKVICPSRFPPVLTCKKKEIFLVLPFTGRHGLQVRHRLKKLLKACFPQVSFKLVFKPSCRLSHFFHFKDTVPTDVRSLVVYEFKCGSCNASYIGKTTRHLRQRVCEHQGISSRTGRELGMKLFSSIRQHSQDTNRPFSFQDFRILSTASNSHDLHFQESLLINKEKPTLNVQTSSDNLSLFC